MHTERGPGVRVFAVSPSGPIWDAYILSTSYSTCLATCLEVKKKLGEMMTGAHGA